MAKSLDDVNNERAVEEQRGREVSGEDAELVVRMVIKMLSEGDGLRVIESAINQSQDPAQVIGQFLAQMLGQLAEQLANEVGVDPAVILAKNGALEKILDYIERKLGYPSEFSDQVYAQVLETIKAGAMSPPAPNDVMGGGQEQAPQQAPQQAIAGGM